MASAAKKAQEGIDSDEMLQPLIQAVDAESGEMLANAAVLSKCVLHTTCM